MQIMAVTLCNWVWRLLIAGVLLIAAYSKWAQGRNYLEAESIYDRIVAFSPWRHYAILAVEALIGLWVLSSIKVRWSSIAGGILFAGFTAVVTAEMFRANPTDCGCGITQIFPDGDPRVDLAFAIGRNVLLLIGCAWLWLMGEDEPAKPESEKTAEQTPA